MKKNRKANHSYETKEKMLKRLRLIEGQVRGIGKMIEKDTYCDDVLHQFASVKAALGAVRYILLEAHLENCVVEQIKKGRLNVVVVKELMQTIKEMNK